jgi:hypothetical protein
LKKILFLILFPITLFAQIPYSIQVTSGSGTDIEKLYDGNVTTGWFPGWNQADYPAKALMVLDSEFYIHKIRFFDNVGKPKITFYGWKGTEKILLLEKELGNFQQWQEWEINNQEKFELLQVEISTIDGDRPVTEIEIYGSTSIAPEPPPVPINYSGDALKIGLNGFHWVPNELLPCPNIRVYQMYQWTWLIDGCQFQPTWDADGKYDSYLETAKNKNQTVIFCINKIPPFLSNQNGQDWQWGRIHRDGCNAEDPESYREVAEYAWQVAARYGSINFPDSLLKISLKEKYPNAPHNEKKSGLNFIQYLEFENEPDRPWEPDINKYTPQQLAAFCSAIWDGHEGTLGTHIGVKNADPNLRIVLPSLSTINLWYLNEMKKWFDANRSDKQFCADVISVHHYCNSKNPWPGNAIDITGFGVSPETDHLDQRLKELKLFCIQNFPHCEVWFGEFGYDTEPPMTVLTQYPLIYSTHSSEELQGQWNLRTFLYGLSNGLDKVIGYNFCDEDSAPMGYVFGSSGFLTSQATGFKKKQSWKDLDWLTREINGFTFNQDISILGVQIFEFKSNHATKYFYWSPTSNDSSKNFRIGRKRLVATEKVQVYTRDRSPFIRLKIK